MTPTKSMHVTHQLGLIPSPVAERLRDGYGRVILDLRISITDACNYRCIYCHDSTTLQTRGLSLEDYARLIPNFVSLGIEKVRLTGGEPLLRHEIMEIIAKTASLKTLDGQPVEVALTTNGHLLKERAATLHAAGLSRVTVSMDAAEREAFERITRVDGAFDRVIEGIREARRVGFNSIKVNCVLMRGFNDDQIEPLIALARAEGFILRFIEFMPLEESRRWRKDVVVTEEEIVERINRRWPVRLLPPNHLSETARRYGFLDGTGEFGVIAPVSRPFCGHCSRIRLTADGKIRTCLFSVVEHDLSRPLRAGASDEDLKTFIRDAVRSKEERHHIGEPGFERPSRAMVQIGG